MGNTKSKSSGGAVNHDMEVVENEYALKSLLKFQSHEFLVFGYIRTRIEPLILSSTTSNHSSLISLGTPHELLQLIISYYNVGIHSHILLWCGSEEKTSCLYNQIYLLNIKNHKKYKLSIYNLNNKLMKPAKTMYFDRLNSNYCSISSIKLPAWILKMETAQKHVSRHKKYHCIFRFGGDLKYDASNQIYKNQCDMLIIDSTKLNAIDNRSNIDSYLCTIPTSLQTGNYSQFQDFSMCFNNNFLILCGGYDENKQTIKCIKRFDLQTLTWDDDKFIQRKMIHARSGVACCIINDKSHKQQSTDYNQLITIGGIGIDGRFTKCVEIYSFLNNTSKSLSNLTRERYNAGCCYLSNKEQLLCVGGCIGSGSKEIEIYDFHKNIWKRIRKKCIYKHINKPLIWNDEMNDNILYIAGGSMYNSKRAQLGGIEMIDMRMSNNWNIINQYNLLSLLELNHSNDVFNDWTARSGMII